MSDETSRESRTAGQAQTQLLEALAPEARRFVEQASSFGDRLRAAIRAIREEKGWKQADLGQRVGVSASTVSRLESGHGLAGFDLGLAAACLAAMEVAPQLTLVHDNDYRRWEVEDDREISIVEPSPSDEPAGAPAESGEPFELASVANAGTLAGRVELLSAEVREVLGFAAEVRDVQRQQQQLLEELRRQIDELSERAGKPRARLGG